MDKKIFYNVPGLNLQIFDSQEHKNILPRIVKELGVSNLSIMFKGKYMEIEITLVEADRGNFSNANVKIIEDV